MTRVLAFGPSPFDPHVGTIVDVEFAGRWRALARAATMRDFVEAHVGWSWEQYVAETGEELLPSDPYDFEEWLLDHSGDTPETVGFDIAAATVEALIADHPRDFDAIVVGGGSPGGNPDSIQGPLEQLERLASTIDPKRCGFTLRRDDEAVAAGTAAHLFVASDRDEGDRAKASSDGI